ncbi:MAG: PA0069 family radical SAM protein [Tepidisphaerales bacterium]
MPYIPPTGVGGTIITPAMDSADPKSPAIKGRGTPENPTNRFERLVVVPDPDLPPEDRPAARTEFLRDATRSVITTNDSPDIPFEASLNPYRGCEHGCVYCFARCMHEYLGFSAGLDFETKIMVKMDAPQLLRKELSARSWKPKRIAIGTATDPYQPVERKLQLTRQCLQVLAEFRNPFTLITKNQLITRDLDILAQAAKQQLTAVYLSITTLDAGLVRVLEPRTSVPRNRLAAIEKLAAAGVSVGVLVSPMIPGLTDHEVASILRAAAAAGVKYAGLQPVRLPGQVEQLFTAWLQRHRPDRAEKVLNRIREMHGGGTNSSNFHERREGKGIFAEQVRELFEMTCRQLGLSDDGPELRTDLFRRVERGQMELFQ